MEIANIGRSVPSLAIDAAVKPGNGEVPPVLVSAVQAANKSELFGHDRELSFSRDHESRRMVIQIKDRKTGEVVQQIPAKELLEMLQTLRGSSNTEPNL